MAEEKIKRFNYTARNNQGQLVGGTIASDDEAGAAKRLQGMGLAPLSIRPTTGSGPTGKRNIGRAKRVKAKDLAILGSQFSTMLDAGLLLVRTIKSVTEQTTHPELKRVLPLVQKNVEEGNNLSSSMAKYPMIFPNLMIGMVAAGEESGHLSESMQQVATNYEKEAKLRSKVFSALLYPAVVLGIAGIMLTAMLLFVVPRFTAIFKTLGGTLPLPTQMLVLFSHIASFAIPIGIVFSFFSSTLWRKYKQDRRLRNVIDPIKLKMPILGKFFQKIALARFSRTFASLLTSGVPMLNAIEIVANTAGSTVISDALLEVRQAVHDGKEISPTLQKHYIFPPLVIQMVSAGEETGTIPKMLNKIADFYEMEVDAASEALTSILEPVLIVFLALIVGSMVISLYLPIFKVFTLIK